MMNRYDFYPGDFGRDTSDLTILEDGIYRRLLDWYYSNEKPIPDDRATLIVRASTDEERQKTHWVLNRFFTKEEEKPIGLSLGSSWVWRSSRCDREIAKARVQIEANRKNGQKGGRPKKTDSLQNKETHIEPIVKPIGKPIGLANGNPMGNPRGNPKKTLPSPSDLKKKKYIYINNKTSKDQVEETSKVDLQPIDEALKFLPSLKDQNLARFILTAWPECTIQDAIAWIQQAKSYLLQLEGDPLEWIQDIATSRSSNDPVYVQGRNKLHQWLMNCLKSTIRKQDEQSKHKLPPVKYGMDN